MPLFRGFFDWKQNTGRIRSAFVDASMDRDMRSLSCFTVKSFPGVTVREHKILGSGSDRYTHTMSRKKGIGQFGRPDRYLIDFVRFQIFRKQFQQASSSLIFLSLLLWHTASEASSPVRLLHLLFPSLCVSFFH